ncbi:MAG: hypothetical protein J07HN6_02508 [Halonotius sp. J07HN6]|nr:MAG: hypothetical protein J07HN6_02508 [Halonotius sp. J07HN6]
MPSTIADESPDGGQTSPESRIGRLSAWLSGHPLHIEAAVAAAAIGLTLVATPFLSFGIFVALEGETAILAIGVAFIAGSLLSVVGLAVTIVGHTYSDIRQHGFPASAELDLNSVVYGGTRAVETVAAVGLLAGLVSVVLASVIAGSVPNLIWAVVVATAVPLPPVVLAHATVTFGRTILTPLLHGN